MIEKIYLDMDGVLADFDLHFVTLYGVSPQKYEEEHGQSEFWEKIYETPRFFEYMPRKPELLDIWFLCKEITENIVVLSSPSRTNISLCIQQKRTWLDNNLGNHVPAIFEKEKHKYSKPGRLLIDDTKSKCDKWIEVGGFAHCYKDFDGLKNYLIKIGVMT